jgi:hypothetical protein
MRMSMKTIDDARSDSVKLWIKRASGSSEAGPYSLKQYELNCDARQIRFASLTNCDASGNFTGSSAGDKWGSVVPDTLGEALFVDICRTGF